MKTDEVAGLRMLGSLGSADGRGVIWEERGMPLDLIAAYGAGIHVHVEDLAAHIAGRGRVDAESRWAELTPAYAELATTDE
jgi:hypothetical protein